ncbi:MAG: hypothetical protein R3267_07760 [Paenisporosarcina sp.]|nr:hypothetical protein [Paenisporosarcina sp.]
MKELSSDHQSLLKKFKRSVNTKSIEKMDKKLYHFFMYHCGFIAHYNLQGFKATYEGVDFLHWFNNFAKPNWMFFHDDEYELLRRACVEYAQEQAHAVYAHFELQERNRKIKLLHALTAEFGEEVATTQTSKQIGSVPASVFHEEGTGQLVLFA